MTHPVRVKSHLVAVTERNLEGDLDLKILSWILGSVPHGEYDLYYRQWTPADDKWRSYPLSSVAIVGFDKKHHAMAFKLMWGD